MDVQLDPCEQDPQMEAEHLNYCLIQAGIPEEEEQKKFKIHKYILCLNSPVFKAMFGGPYIENRNNFVNIIDISVETFRTFLYFIYNYNIKLTSIEEVCKLLYLAEKYMVDSLKKKCSNYILKHLSDKNTLQFYEIGELYFTERIQKAARKRMIKRTYHILEHTTFLDMSFATLLMLLSQEELNIPEFMLYKKVQQWFTHYTESNEINRHDQRMCKDKIIGRFRFLSMSPEEFSEATEKTTLLTCAEIKILLYHLISKSKKRLPKKYSHQQRGIPVLTRNKLKKPSPSGGND